MARDEMMLADLAKAVPIYSEVLRKLTWWQRKLDGNIAVIGLEAGSLSQWLQRGLTKADFDLVLMDTRQVKGALKAMSIKTDRRDAEGIARLLYMGWCRPFHCKPVPALEVGAVLDARKTVQQGGLALKMLMRGLMRNFGLKVGAISRCRFERRIRELTTGNLMLEVATEPTLRARSSLRQQLAGLKRRVRQLGSGQPPHDVHARLRRRHGRDPSICCR